MWWHAYSGSVNKLISRWNELLTDLLHFHCGNKGLNYNIIDKWFNCCDFSCHVFFCCLCYSILSNYLICGSFYSVLQFSICTCLSQTQTRPWDWSEHAGLRGIWTMNPFKYWFWFDWNNTHRRRSVLGRFWIKMWNKRRWSDRYLYDPCLQ